MATPCRHRFDGMDTGIRLTVGGRARRPHLADISAPRFAERDLWKVFLISSAETSSLRFDVGRPDHLAPLL